jgi:TusA-related sulfurtransferase
MTPPKAETHPISVAAVDGGDLALGAGLLALVRSTLDVMEPGGVLAVLSSSSTVREDLPSWCRFERHRYVGLERAQDGRDQHLIERGRYSHAAGAKEPGIHLPRKPLPERLRADPAQDRPPERLQVTSADMLATVPMPPRADPHTGFAPRGARVEPGGPEYPFTLLDRDSIAPPEVAQIYDQAVVQQWDASRDIAWEKIQPGSPQVEAAIGQIMTFLAENELSALYVPARFLPRIHPAYAEVAMLIAQQLADEARHIDVFMKRARIAGGGAGISTAITSRSLHSLLQPDDFTEATFLLSVLGEGTFLDLLRFIEDNAPDETTANIMRRARNDEARHVRFGLAHVRHALAQDPSLYGRLEAAVHRRAATLGDSKSVPAPVQDALTILSAGGVEPRALAQGHEKFQKLLQDMSDNRVTRLLNAGFTQAQAEVLSGLHTSNFM